MDIVRRAKKEQRSLSEAEHAEMAELRPVRCNYALDKLKRVAARKRRNERKRKLTLKRKMKR